MREKYCWLVPDKPSEQGGTGAGKQGPTMAVQCALSILFVPVQFHCTWAVAFARHLRLLCLFQAGDNRSVFLLRFDASLFNRSVSRLGFIIIYHLHFTHGGWCSRVKEVPSTSKEHLVRAGPGHAYTITYYQLSSMHA
jgi:hypothetical protein